MPAQAGIQLFQQNAFWIPACAGMTQFNNAIIFQVK
jgi:hypothetical protein